MLQRFFADDSGQDLIEYSLLAALIAIVSIVTWQQIATTIGTGYAASDTGVHVGISPAGQLSIAGTF